MHHSKIFLLDNDATTLFPMEERGYDAERLLQESLATSPDLLPGWQIDPDNPRRWLLVKREAGIPCQQDGGDYWSLDHIFVDQDGIPTLVECKRATDRRLRREVMGQMLDYAANAVAYWPKGKLRLLAAQTAAAGSRTLEEGLRELLQLAESPTETEQDVFWETVDANLVRGCLRLLFVSDVIPKELRRLVEFLNAKMEDVEILGIELKQFVSAQGNLKAFVPSVIGQSERNLADKASGKKKHDSIETQLATYPCKAVFETIIRSAKEHGHRVDPGITNFSIKCFIGNKLTTYAFGKKSGPVLQFSTEYLASHPTLKIAIEHTLLQLGHPMTGKHAVNIAVNENADALLHALSAVIAVLNDYAVQSAS